MKRGTRTKTRNLPTTRPRDHSPPREEHDIFSELAALCVSPGFAHAIAYICYRDNLLRFGGELTPGDLSHFYSASVLVRTEIAILIGLLARQPIDFTLPELSVLQHYLDRAQDLLHELHQALCFSWFKHFRPEVFRGEAPICSPPELLCVSPSSMVGILHTIFSIPNSQRKNTQTIGIGC